MGNRPEFGSSRRTVILAAFLCFCVHGFPKPTFDQDAGKIIRISYQGGVQMSPIHHKFSSLFVSLWLAGCSASTQVTHTQRSSIEQRLLVRSLDRSLDQLDTVALQETVAVDFYGLTPDKDFAKEFCIAWLQGRRIKVVADPSRADVRLKVFAPVLGVDQGQSFFGMPSLTVPFLGVTMPEIALFKIR